MEIKRSKPKRAGCDFSYDNRSHRGGGTKSYGGSFGRGSGGYGGSGYGGKGDKGYDEYGGNYAVPCMVALDMQVLGTVVMVRLLAMVEAGVMEVEVVVEPLQVMVLKDMVGQLEGLEALLLLLVDMVMDTGMTVVKGMIMAAVVVPGAAPVAVEGFIHIGSEFKVGL